MWIGATSCSSKGFKLSILGYEFCLFLWRRDVFFQYRVSGCFVFNGVLSTGEIGAFSVSRTCKTTSTLPSAFLDPVRRLAYT